MATKLKVKTLLESLAFIQARKIAKMENHQDTRIEDSQIRAIQGVIRENYPEVKLYERPHTTRRVSSAKPSQIEIWENVYEPGVF